MYLRNLFLIPAIVAIAVGSAGLVTADDGTVRSQTFGHEQQMKGPLDTRPAVEVKAEAVVQPGAVTAAPYRSESAQALIATVQGTAPAMACRMPGSPTRANLPFCAPATSLAPASASQPVMVW